MKGQACHWRRFNPVCKLQCVNQMDSKDPQRYTSYCWEEFLFDLLDQHDEKEMPLVKCDDLICSMCDRFGITKPKLKDGRGCCAALAGSDIIHLPRYFRDYLSTIHEACHVIGIHILPDEPSHGPSFIRLCIYHFSKHFEIETDELEESAKGFGLEFADRLSCLPPPWFKVKAIIAQRKIMKGFSIMRRDAEERVKSFTIKELAAKRRYKKLSRETSKRLWRRT